jgi:peptide/nickel transport system substrate-binding protein
VGWCKDVGIKLSLDQKDEGAFSDEIYDNANYDMFVWSWGGDIDPGFMLSTFTTTQILNWGDSQYSNSEYDKLYVEQAEALDAADPEDTSARKAITDKMQTILYRDNPYIILWYNVSLQAFRTDTWTGYDQVSGKDGAPFWNYMRGTYISLRPVTSAVAKTSGGTPAWVWATVVTGIVVVIAAVVLIRRRPRAVEDE